MFLTGKYKDSVGPKECMESIYVKITETQACVSDELCCLLKQLRRRWTNHEFRRFAYKACTGLLTIRVVVLEYS